jgi:hypothetical protein
MRGKARAISRRGLLRACSLSLLCAPLLSACGSKPRSEDVTQLIRDGDYDAARVAAETLIEHGSVDGQMPLLAGALALQAGDFTRAQELFAVKPGPAGDASQTLFATGIEQDHWLRLTALRSGNDIASGITDAVFLDPLGAAIAGKISAQEFVGAKVKEARRIADATVLSIQQSPGRDSLLDRLAGEREPQYRCTGNFIAAERMIAASDAAAARGMLMAALETKAEDLLEFHIAKAELMHLS